MVKRPRFMGLMGKAATRMLPRRIVSMVRPVKAPLERTMPKAAKTMGLRNIEAIRFKDAAQAANMTTADIVRGHGIYGDPATGNPPVPAKGDAPK